MLLTTATQPPRLWRAQLPRLMALAAFLFMMTAIGADGVPPVTQPRVSGVALVSRLGIPGFERLRVSGKTFPQPPP